MYMYKGHKEVIICRCGGDGLEKGEVRYFSVNSKVFFFTAMPKVIEHIYSW